MSRKIFSFHGQAALVAGTASLLLLTGCVNDMPHRGAWSGAPQNKRVLAALNPPDVYFYYPDYAIYYNQTQHSYVSLENGVWLTRSVPAGVSAAGLFATLAVPMTFHDAPAEHHAIVLKSHPATHKHRVSRHQGVPKKALAVGQMSGSVK